MTDILKISPRFKSIRLSAKYFTQIFRALYGVHQHEGGKVTEKNCQDLLSKQKVITQEVRQIKINTSPVMLGLFSCKEKKT